MRRRRFLRQFFRARQKYFFGFCEKCVFPRKAANRAATGLCGASAFLRGRRKTVQGRAIPAKSMSDVVYANLTR